MFRNWRIGWGRRTLNKEVSKRKREVRSIGFATAKSIGILFEVGDEADYDLLKKYAKYLKEEGKKFSVLGFCDMKELPPEYKDSLEFSFITRKELSYFFKPSGNRVEDFLKEDFDILIDLSVGENFPLLYISGLSGASFKVGRMSPDRKEFFDMMIDLKEDASLKALFKEIDHYLNVLK